MLLDNSSQNFYASQVPNTNLLYEAHPIICVGSKCGRYTSMLGGTRTETRIER